MTDLYKQNVPQYIKERVSEKVRHCILMFNSQYNFLLTTPAIKYDLRGTTAGEASYSKYDDSLGIIKLNKAILLDPEQTDRYINRTVPHELAHLLVHDYYVRYQEFNQYTRTGRRKSEFVHGKYWEHVMKIIGVPEHEITRCHDYKVKSVRKTRRFIYSCECPTGNNQHEIATRTHNKMRKYQEFLGNSGYTCKRCGGTLKFVEELGK